MEFLQAALSEVCKGQLDEVEQMKRCVSVLLKDDTERREDEEDEDEKEVALEALCDLCDNMDNARGVCVCEKGSLNLPECV